MNLGPVEWDIGNISFERRPCSHIVGYTCYNKSTIVELVSNVIPAATGPT